MINHRQASNKIDSQFYMEQLLKPENSLRTTATSKSNTKKGANKPFQNNFNFLLLLLTTAVLACRNPCNSCQLTTAAVDKTKEIATTCRNDLLSFLASTTSTKILFKVFK